MTKRHSVPLTALGTAIGLASLTMAPSAAQACSDTESVGTVCIMATDFCPKGMLPPNGKTYSLNQYSALFRVIGCNYGGDCMSTFAVPDLRGRSIVSRDYDTTSDILPLGAMRGVETVAQTLNSLPPHTHGLPTTDQELTVQGTIPVIPGAGDEVNGTETPEAGITYALGGLDLAASGPYTTRTLGETTAAVKGVKVTLTAGPYLGTTSTGAAVPRQNLPPQMPLTICIVAK